MSSPWLIASIAFAINWQLIKVLKIAAPVSSKEWLATSTPFNWSNVSPGISLKSLIIWTVAAVAVFVSLLDMVLILSKIRFCLNVFALSLCLTFCHIARKKIWREFHPPKSALFQNVRNHIFAIKIKSYFI